MALPPGPRMPGMLSLLKWMAWPTETLAEAFVEYGDLYSVNNPMFGREVIVNHPELIRQIFTGDPEVFHGGEPNRVLAPILGRSVLMLDGLPHRRQRKLLMPPFHGKRLAIYAETMRAITERVVRQWPQNEQFALLPSMQRITFEVILQTVFGVTEGEEIERLRDELLTVVENAQSPLGMLMMLPTFQRDLGPLTPWAKLQRALKRADAAIYDIIAKARRQAPEGRDDVLAMLLAAVDEDGEPLSDRELRDELMTLLVAGHETTATALCWAFEEILRRPAVLATLGDELADHPAPDAKLPYLDATIREVLRLRPIVALLMRMAKRPVTLRHYELPANTLLVPCPYNAQRHPDYWPEPHAFKPERFLDHRPDPYAWFPFGGGERRCIGMAFALYEMRVVLATVLSEVSLRARVEEPLKVSLRSFTLVPKGGAPVVVTGRAA